MILTFAGKDNLNYLKRKMNMFSSLFIIFEYKNQEKMHVIACSFLFSN